MVVLLCCQPQSFANVYYGETIAVMPFENFSETRDVADAVSSSFAQQLTEWSGAFVYHPALIRSTLKADDRFQEKMPAQEKALLLGDVMNASVVIYGAVTEYDGFSPYALGVAIEVVRVDTGERILAKNFSFKGFSLWPEKTRKSLLPRTMNAYIEYVISDLVKSYF
jgi:TolB-like protein